MITKLSENKILKKEGAKVLKILGEVLHKISKNWLELRLKYPHYSDRLIIEKIAELEEIAPITVVIYGRESKVEHIRKNCERIQTQILVQDKNITSKWENLRKLYPEWSVLRIIRKLSKILAIRPTTVASYATASRDEDVRIEAGISYGLLLIKKHNIEWQWIKLEKKNPLVLPENICILISRNINISPISVADYAIHSRISEIKSKANKAVNALLLKHHDLEKRWFNLKEQNPSLSTIALISNLSKTLNLKPISVASYFRWSKNFEIRTNINKVYYSL